MSKIDLKYTAAFKKSPFDPSAEDVELDKFIIAEGQQAYYIITPTDNIGVQLTGFRYTIVAHTVNFGNMILSILLPKELKEFQNQDIKLNYDETDGVSGYLELRTPFVSIDFNNNREIVPVLNFSLTPEGLMNGKLTFDNELLPAIKAVCTLENVPLRTQ